MRAGTINRLFTVLQVTETRQSNGEVASTYAAASSPVKFWGRLVAAGGMETFNANVDRTEQRYTIETRYRTDLTAKLRLSHDGVTYQIAAPPFDPDGKRRHTHIPVVVLG